MSRFDSQKFAVTLACITDQQKIKYDYLKSDKSEWPAVFLNEQKNDVVKKYENIFKNKSIDLSGLISNEK